MADVWDENWSGSTKTLDMHVLGLRRKLAAAGCPASRSHAARVRLPVRGRLRPRRLRGGPVGGPRSAAARSPVTRWRPGRR